VECGGTVELAGEQWEKKVGGKVCENRGRGKKLGCSLWGSYDTD